MVTAQKREETVQDIGIAVTAISSETREEIGLLMTNHTKGHGHFVPKAGHGAASVPVSASTTPEFRQ